IADRQSNQQIGHDFDPPFGEGNMGHPRSALKLVILFADGPPGGFDGQFNQAAMDRVLEFSTEARMDCVRIAAFQFGINTDTEDIMVNYADSTCGWYAQTVGSDSSVVRDMILSMMYEDLPDCSGNAEGGLPDCGP